jgi:hypothetical protein
MKKILAALILSLALPAAACRAGDGHCCSFGTAGTISYGFKIKVCASGCLRWNPCGCGGPSCCDHGGGYGGGFGGGAPWYSYWPLEAHFQVPAPTGFPYWPSPMVSSLAFGPGGGYGFDGGAYQQVGYFPQGPSYWYGR